MTIYKEAILNGITGEVEYKDFTPEELEAHNAKYQEALEREEAELAQAAAKQAAQDKLKALGLTDLEIAAITGA